MSTSARTLRAYASRSPLSATGDDFGPDLDMVEIGDVSGLDDLVSRGDFVDSYLDQLRWPIRKISGNSSIRAVEIVAVRDPLDEGQRHLKSVSGHNEPFQFEIRLDDGAGSQWAFTAFVTGYTTRFPRADADQGDVVVVSFELDAIGPAVETNSLGED